MVLRTSFAKKKQWRKSLFFLEDFRSIFYFASFFINKAGPHLKVPTPQNNLNLEGGISLAGKKIMTQSQ